MKKRLFWAALVLLIPSLGLAGTITRGTKAGGGTDFSAGATILAAEMNTDFNTVYNVINGNIDNANIASSPRIDPEKVDDQSATAAEGQGTSDPYAGDSQVVATDLSIEVRQLRFQVKQLLDSVGTASTYWYEDPHTAWSAGDVKCGFKTSADTGWVMLNDGTIGDPNSGADTAAANTSTLYGVIWDNIIDNRTLTDGVTIDPNDFSITSDSAHGLTVGDRIYFTNVLTDPNVNNSFQVVQTVPTTTTITIGTTITSVGDGDGNWRLAILQDSSGVPAAKGANAAADFSAAKRIQLPLTLGRTFVAADPTPSGTAPNAAAHELGDVGGDETHTLAATEIPAHAHDIALGNGGGSTTTRVSAWDGIGDVGDTSGLVKNTGGGGAHNNMPPALYVNCMIKL